MENEERKVVKLELTESQYRALEEIAKKQGYPLVSDFLRALIAEISSGEWVRELPSSGLQELLESITKRLERRIEDLLNPFTGKIDDINRKISDLIELFEAVQSRLKTSSVEREETPKTRVERIEKKQKARRPSAMEKLHEQKVVFYSDVAWMKAPDRLFQKLEREGAIVFSAAGEMVGVDPGFWQEFVKLLSEFSISDPEDVGTLLSSKLGEQARKLFMVLLRGGLAYFDRDLGSWIVRVESKGQSGPTSR